MFRSTLCITVALAAALVSYGYPVTVTNCGVTNTVNSAPTRVITMNQGATEFMLGMGLEESMVGTAYLDDAIWPRYAASYNKIPVLGSSYPNDTVIMAQSPDFIVGSYNSAFRAQYTDGDKTRGIFSTETVGSCTGKGSDWGEVWTTCRPQLHAKGIGTYLFEDSCEEKGLRPTTVTEETVYEEMRALGSVFGVDVQPKIDEMKKDFDQAAGLVSAGLGGEPLKTVWVDCVGRCCQDEEGDEEHVFVGGGTGAPNMLMQEAGLTNVFAEKSGNWVCVKISEIAAAKPDVLVIVDADWDKAIDKIRYLYDDAAFCQLEVLRAARLISIPFSASTLSPRNGPAALDLAVAALHVRTGSHTVTQQSGVGSFSPYFLQAETACSRCPLKMSYVMYDDETDSAQNYDVCTTTPAPTVAKDEDVSKAISGSLGLFWWAAVGAATVMISA